MPRRRRHLGGRGTVCGRAAAAASVAGGRSVAAPLLALGPVTAPRRRLGVSRGRAAIAVSPWPWAPGWPPSGGVALVGSRPTCGALVPRRDGACCHRLWAGIGVKAKALVRLWTGDGDVLEGVTLSRMPSSLVSSPGENLDHFGRTTTAPFASLPHWRRCPGSSCRWWSYSLLEEDPLLHLPSLSFLYIVQVALVVGWRMLCRPSLRWQIPCRWATLADALPLSSLVGVLFGRMLCRRCWLVG